MTLRIAERMAHDWLQHLDAAMAAYAKSRPVPHDTNATGPDSTAATRPPSEVTENQQSSPQSTQETPDTKKEETKEPQAPSESEPTSAKPETAGADAAAQKQAYDGARPDASNANDEDDQEAEKRRKQLRDCFVDDGWTQQEGFDNPTAAMYWLTEERRFVGAVRSIDIPEESSKTSRVVFELLGRRTETVEAHVIVADRKPRCCYLKRAQTGSQEGGD